MNESKTAPVYAGNQVHDLKELGPAQLDILNAQLAEHERLNTSPLHSQLRDRFAAGDTTLPAGSLIHGMTIDDIESVAAYGVMSGELFGKGEYGETHYCADFFRVDKATTVAAYLQDITGREPGSVTPRMEKTYLPNSSKSGQYSLGVIVDADIPELQPLLAADVYRDGTEELFEGIVGHLPVERGAPKASRLSAILGGTPATAIAGIVMGDQIASTPGALERVSEAFHGQMPILSPGGEVLNTVPAVVA